MTARLCGVWLLLTLMAEVAGAQDVRTVLTAAAKNMGADRLKCITYSGTGYVGLVGQHWRPADDWPRIELSSYTRAINYDDRSSREERVTRQGKYPPRGGGGIPIQGEQRQTLIVSGTYAWNIQGTSTTPARAAAEQRQLDIWLTPHGFLKAAMAPGANPTLITRYESGALGGLSSTVLRKVNIVSFVALGKYRVNGTITDQNLVERVQTWVPNPVRGDMNYETEYSGWQDFGGVKFPTGWHHHDDWDDETQPPNYNGGHNGFGGVFDKVEINACGAALAVPEAVQKATVPPVRVESQKLAEGVYYLTGGSHHSVAVEFRNYVVVVEAPQNEERVLAVIAEVNRLVPGKPIRYAVNTHHHFDHLGGIRTLFHEGATIIAHLTNRDFYKQEVLSYASRTLQPDRLALHPPTEFAEGYQFETVDVKYVLSDGTRTMDLYYVQGNPHSEGMLVAYLPKERILIEADLFTPPAPNAPAPTAPSAANMTLYNNVKAYQLEVSTLAPLHGRVVPWGDFLKVVGKTD